MGRVIGRTGGGLLRRHHDFRMLWCGETAGKYGAAVASVSMPLIAVSELRAGTFEVGLLSAAVWLPWLLIGLPVGVWVDRWRCRPIMLIAAATSLVALLVVPVAAWSGRLSIALLLAVGLVTGTASVFFQTAYSAYLPIILTPDDQPEGNAKLHGSASAAQIAGLGSGGVIAQVAGAVNGLLVNAAAFLVALLCLARIRHREPRTGRAGERTTTLVGEVLDGLRLIAGDPWFRALTLFGGASNLALMGYQAIQVVFLVRTVGLAPGTVGALIAATSAGGVAGALVVRRVADRIGTARALLLFEVVVPVLGLLMPLTTGGAGVLLFAVGGFCIAAGAVAGNVLKAGFQQRYCPPGLLGRLITSTAFVSYGTIPLGALLGGALGSVLDPRTALAITVAGVPLAGLVLLLSPIRGVRDLPVARPATSL